MSGPLEFRQFDQGLWVAAPADTTPAGAVRRGRGLVRPTPGVHARSRWGAASVVSLAGAPHSAARFADSRYAGVGTTLTRDGASIATGLSGARLTFAAMSPTVGVADYLYVAGGGVLKKVSSAGAVSAWGIAAPAAAPTTAVVAVASKTIDALSNAASWTGASATLADEATIKQEGANSLKMTVAASALGTASKAVVTDLTTFGASASLPEDFIALWVRVDNPANVEMLQVVFDLAGGAFATDTYTRTISVSDEIPPSSQFVTETVGIASLPEYVTQQERFVVDEGGQLSSLDSVGVLDKLGQTTITTATGTWVYLRLSKATFQRSGDAALGWDDVQAVRLVVKTNSRGQAIVYWDDLVLLGGAGLQGAYQYKATYYSSVTGVRSNPSPASTALTVQRQGVTVSGLTASADAQVTHVEVWRTLGGGTLYFKAGQVTNGTTTFTDTVADAPVLNSASGTTYLQSLLLPDDNDVPAATLGFGFGPFNGRMLTCGDSAAGARGRLYYSPVGRPDAIEGYLDATHDDDPTQGGVVWNGAALLWTQGHLFQVIDLGGALDVREVMGVPGTDAPHTIAASPVGVFYQARDGVRVFTGATSELVGDAALGPIWRGESAEQLVAFEGTVATYGNDEYLVSDGVQALAWGVTSGAWRDLGLGLTALAYEADTGLVLAGLGSALVTLETEGTLTDAGTAIPFTLQPGETRVGPSAEALVRRVFVDADTASQTLTPTLLVDGVEVALAPMVTASRQVYEWVPLRHGRRVSVRLAGSLSARVQVWGIALDLWAPEAGA